MYHLELSGSPRQRGEQHGESFRKQIQELAEIRRELVLSYLKPMPLLQVETLALAQAQFLSKKHPDLYEEFCGIAEASKLSAVDLIILNNYTDMRDFSSESTFSLGDGCSVFSIKTATETFCGQTWDMHASAKPYVLHLTVPAVQKTPRMEVLTVTGCLGLAGFNERGVVVLINNLSCTETEVKLIWPALVRKMLEKSSAQEAFQSLTQNLPCSGHNYLICDPKESLNIETTAKQYEVTGKISSEGVLFHTNHFIGKLKNKEITERLSQTTHKRYDSLEKYFKKVSPEKLTRTQWIRDLFIQGEPCHTICQPRPDPVREPHGPMTCGGLWVDLKAHEAEFFGGLYQDKDIRSVRWRAL